MRKRAIIVGSNGQDGQLLSKYLIKKEYKIIGVTRNSLDILNYKKVNQLVESTQPNEIYYLAAYHHTSEMKVGNYFDLLSNSFDINVQGVINFLSAIEKFCLSAKFFYASSCLIFKPFFKGIQNENTPYSPDTPYGITKLTSSLICKNNRNNNNLFCCVGILYNHESIITNKKFVSKKIAKAAAKIFSGSNEKLILGNLEAEVDWGYAPDYVDAMYKILQCKDPTDFIIATGESHTVREFVQTAFNHLGLDYKKYIKIDNKILHRNNNRRVGDASKLRELTGWKPSITFNKMVCKLVDAELDQIKVKN